MTNGSDGYNELLFGTREQTVRIWKCSETSMDITMEWLCNSVGYQTWTWHYFKKSCVQAWGRLDKNCSKLQSGQYELEQFEGHNSGVISALQMGIELAEILCQYTMCAHLIDEDWIKSVLSWSRHHCGHRPLEVNAFPNGRIQIQHSEANVPVIFIEKCFPSFVNTLCLIYYYIYLA